MKESEVMRVMLKLLSDQKTEFYKQKGSGPDILVVDNGIIEMKGTGFDTNRAFEQFVRYPLTYITTEIAMPLDALKIDTLFVLLIIESSLRAAKKHPIGVYLIAKVGETENKYKVQLFSSVKQLFECVCSGFDKKLSLASEKKTDMDELIQKNAHIVQNIENEFEAVLSDELSSLLSHDIIV